jgi:hypothetical protein
VFAEVFSNLAVALLVTDPSGRTKDEDAELVTFKYILSFQQDFLCISSRSVWGSAAIKVIQWWGCRMKGLLSMSSKHQLGPKAAGVQYLIVCSAGLCTRLNDSGKHIEFLFPWNMKIYNPSQPKSPDKESSHSGTPEKEQSTDVFLLLLRCCVQSS